MSRLPRRTVSGRTLFDPGVPAEGLGWEIARYALVAAVVLGNVVYAVIDRRALWDPGRYFTRVPGYYWDQLTVGGFVSSFFEALVTSSGWYEWGLAAAMHVFGRSPLVFALAGAFWLAVLLVLAGDVAKRLGGPAAALAAVAFTAAIPSVTTFARIGWIHVPEAALLMGILAVHARDPELRARWSPVAVAVLGTLVIALRESGLVWVWSMVPLLALAHRIGPGTPPKRRALAIVLGTWLVATLPAALRIAPYVIGKLGARARYVLQTPPLKAQYAEALSEAGLVLLGIGLVAFLWQARRHWHPQLPVLAGWVLVPIGLFIVFYAGFTNYTPFMPALAVAAALGYTWLAPATLALPLGALALIWTAWAPLPLDATQQGRDLRDVTKPWTGFHAPEIVRLLDASCPTDEWRSCHVLVEQGLFYPASEELGLFELFLMGEDRVDLRSPFDEPEGGWGDYTVDAAAIWRCGEADDAWRRRAPSSTERMIKLLRAKGLDLAFQDQVDQSCAFYWFTKNGRFLDARMAPNAWYPTKAPRWSEELAMLDLAGFQRRNPEFARSGGVAQVYTQEMGELGEAPAAWSRETASAARSSARIGLTLIPQWMHGFIEGARQVYEPNLPGQDFPGGQPGHHDEPGQMFVEEPGGQPGGPG
jgi:hypothetical protein